MSETRPTAKVIATRGECVALVRSSRGNWKFPGGGQERFDFGLWLWTARRELWEEARLWARVLVYLGTIVGQPDVDKTVGMEYGLTGASGLVEHYFWAAEPEGDLAIGDSREIIDTQWAHVDAVMGLLAYETNRRGFELLSEFVRRNR